MKITRALISVSNKAGIAAFARALESQGVDTNELIQRVNVVHDNSVVNNNVSGGTFNGPAAFGRDATATVNGASAGNGNAAAPKGGKKA